MNIEQLVTSLINLMVIPFEPWWCLLFHKLKVNKVFSDTTRCVSCSCGKFYAMNDAVKAFLPWDDEFTDLHDYRPRVEEVNGRGK